MQKAGGNSMLLVVTDGYTVNPGDLSWDILKEFGDVKVYKHSAMDDAELISRIGEADIVISAKAKINRNVIESCQNIKFITLLGTGYDNVDYEFAAERGIAVSNIPDYGTASIAQYAIALLLTICGRVDHHSDAVHEGRWGACPDWCFWDYPLVELSGKTMGIIGFGRIGRNVGKVARALGMDVIAYNRSRSAEGELIADYVGLDELYERSDVISLHIPLFPETFEIINRDSIARMKRGVIIINNSRGALVNEQALAEALKFGKVYAAGLDVVSEEPISDDNPLLKAPNCIITPHISWAPRESRQRILQFTADNIRAFIAGQIRNRVN